MFLQKELLVYISDVYTFVNTCFNTKVYTVVKTFEHKMNTFVNTLVFTY